MTGNICSPQMCTGCQLCRNVCPAEAVSISLNAEGFYAPHIDEKKCIHCNLCVQRCPVNIEPAISVRDHTAQRFYAGWIKNSHKRLASSSGGIFTAAAEAVLADGGVVFGVRFDCDCGAKFDFCENVAGLEKFRGSKYVQADVGDTYRRVALFLKQHRTVLFSGTPCQVAALRSYLRTAPENLICLDLICHGTPSPGTFLRHLAEIEAKKGKKIADFQFRTKKTGWDFLCSSMRWEDGSKDELSFTEVPFIRLFLKDINLNEACHHCRYTSLERTGDLTIADFWGYRPKLSHPLYWRGVSQIICNSQKGERLLAEISSKIYLKEVPKEQASQINYSLKQPFPPDPRRSEFFADYQRNATIEELTYRLLGSPSPTSTRCHRIINRGKLLFPQITKCLKIWLKK